MAPSPTRVENPPSTSEKKEKKGGFKWKENKRPKEDDNPKSDTGRTTEEPQPTKKPKKDKKDKKEKKEKKAAAPVPTGEPMIIVNVNDRLGTKAAIPCLASDPISLCSSSLSSCYHS
jgi:hypothetical protein